jgi:uncharacterized protein (TIGR03790 family)
MRLQLASFLLMVLAVPALAGGGPAETVVLVNSASADSKKVAEHYAKKRQIPRAQICEVKCTAELATPMDDFVRDVVDPLRTFLRDRGLEDRVRFVVMTQGMPIVARTPGGDVSTAATLSVLDTPICGRPQTFSDIARRAVPNPYQDGPAPSGRVLEGGRFLLVTALVSSTVDEAIALVDRSVASDGTAPRGARFVFQDANGNANVRNDKYDAARVELETAGFAAERDAAGADKVRGRENVMGYMSGGSYSALSVDGVNSNRYLPGAICDMLQSYGAVPANFNPDPKSGKSQFPVTHMVRAGITGVHGAVSEPFSFSFPDVRLFATYAEGYTLAEAFHRHLPIVYWMNLTLGDPLCAPYAKRPVPTVERKPDGLEVSAPGAARIDVYADGRPLGGVEGERGVVPFALPGGTYEVLVEATGPGPTEPRGWTIAKIAESNARPRPSTLDARVRCEKLLVEAPATVRAGETASLRITAVVADGLPLDGWKGRVEVRTSSPPVRWASMDAASSSVEVPLTFTKATNYDLRVTAPDDGREATTKLAVGADVFEHLTTPANNYPLGQAADLVVVAEDKYGNRVKDWAGVVFVEVPEDGLAELPQPAAMTAASGGACRIRGLLIGRAGPTKLVFKGAGGAVLSAPDEGVTVGHAAIRPWLVAGPGPAKELFAGDPTASATGDGSVAAKLLLRRSAGGDVLSFSPADAKRAEAALLVTWVEAFAPTKARLLAAAPGRLRVFLDGKSVFDGASKATDGKGKREPIAELELSEGTHRLVVVVETKGATSASFEIDDGAGKHPQALRVRARAAAPPKTFVVSGRFAFGPGGGGAAGAQISVKCSDGKTRTAVSGADGTWYVEGAPPGEVVATGTFRGEPIAPAERRATIEDENLVDLDFGAVGRPQGGGK